MMARARDPHGISAWTSLNRSRRSPPHVRCHARRCPGRACHHGSNHTRVPCRGISRGGRTVDWHASAHVAIQAKSGVRDTWRVRTQTEMAVEADKGPGCSFTTAKTGQTTISWSGKGVDHRQPEGAGTIAEIDRIALAAKRRASWRGRRRNNRPKLYRKKGQRGFQSVSAKLPAHASRRIRQGCWHWAVMSRPFFDKC